MHIEKSAAFLLHFCCFAFDMIGLMTKRGAIDNMDNSEKPIGIGEAIERVLIASGLSVTDFSRKTGYSRQYIYNLMKNEAQGVTHKIQLDTLKTICEATGYSLVSLLADLGYIPRLQKDLPPNTIVIVKKDGQRAPYPLTEQNVLLLDALLKSLEKRIV